MGGAFEDQRDMEYDTSVSSKPVELTPAERYARILSLYKQIGDLRNECDHSEIRGKGERDKGARCVGCGKDFGWGCPESPDGVCHYPYDCEGDEDWIWLILIDGSKINITDEQYSVYHECCMFCGDPDERK